MIRVIGVIKSSQSAPDLSERSTKALYWSTPQLSERSTTIGALHNYWSTPQLLERSTGALHNHRSAPDLSERSGRV